MLTRGVGNEFYHKVIQGFFIRDSGTYATLEVIDLSLWKIAVS
jgi:hypothetical protein